MLGDSVARRPRETYFLPCSSHLGRQKRETQAEEDQPRGALQGILVPGSGKHREMSRFVTVEPRKTTSCSRRWTAHQPTIAEGSDPCPPGSLPGPLICNLLAELSRGIRRLFTLSYQRILTPQMTMLAQSLPVPNSVLTCCHPQILCTALPCPERAFPKEPCGQIVLREACRPLL